MLRKKNIIIFVNVILSHDLIKDILSFNPPILKKRLIQKCGTTFEYKKYSFIACSWRPTQAILTIQMGIPCLVKGISYRQKSLSCYMYNSHSDT